MNAASERNSIIANLTEIDNYIDDPQNFLLEFEELKILLRSFNVRNFSERQIEFELEIEEVRKIKIQLQQELIETQEIKKTIEEINSTIEGKIEESNINLTTTSKNINELIKKTNDFIEQSKLLDETNIELSAIKEKAQVNLDAILLSLTESKSNEKLITSFATNVQEREKKLSELEQNTNENNIKLNEYENERISIITKSKELIESAKKALNYKTAEGISASFQSQYNKANDKTNIGWWIFGAIICLIFTILLGVYILESTTTSTGLIIGRISLLPLPIIGAVFCANQYTKEKNIIEDYAYKMVLSKSIVGFSEQLKKNGSETNEEYIHYIKTALEEIHKDPLRKREKGKQNKTESPQLKDLVEIAEKIVKMTKTE